jgi:Ca2+/H+ antiporter, TMEM165/GDT1 family
VIKETFNTALATAVLKVSLILIFIIKQRLLLLRNPHYLLICSLYIRQKIAGGNTMTSENLLITIWPFLLCTGLITLNEIGDKSQFLAMAFASRMKLHKVLLGILLAVVVLNALAVVVGTVLASVPGWQGWVRFISAALFLIFGLWSLKSEDEEDDKPQNRKRSYGDIAVVFVSFFFSEMGDKTQLVTISLAARYPSAPLLVLAGSTLGMMIADGVGIFAGVVAHRKLPERALKIISASLFIFFGVIGVWQSLHDTFKFSVGTSLIVSAITAIATVTLGCFIYRKNAKN